MTARFDNPDRAREWCDEVHERRATLGFVPTMGALHEGHLSLIERARAENDSVCASVFVNPLQFDERSDFERYPRDFERDALLLERAGCSMVFTGTLEQFFPGRVRHDGTLDPRALLAPGESAAGLEGELRPGHFAGVATIVARLFEIVTPTRAYFGAKDFQQTLVVRDLVRERGGPEIRVCPTVREPSGLARSSRNERLTPAQRETATALARALENARSAWRAGERDPARLGETMRGVLARAAISVEYATVRDPERWTSAEPRRPLERAVALIAARVDGVRLIDNMRLDRDGGAA